MIDQMEDMPAPVQQQGSQGKPWYQVVLAGWAHAACTIPGNRLRALQTARAILLPKSGL